MYQRGSQWLIHAVQISTHLQPIQSIAAKGFGTVLMVDETIALVIFQAIEEEEEGKKRLIGHNKMPLKQ